MYRVRGAIKSIIAEYLSEIDPRYNNIIILDDLMAEATDSPVVARLFTQGR
jgi:predicted RNA polymerase sigma factor